MTTTTFIIPILAERAAPAATATDSKGCIQCPEAKCPTCKKNEVCELTQGTCKTCPVYRCVRDSSSSGLTNTGGIVGGAVGGIAALALLGGFLLYWFVYRKRRSFEVDEQDLYLEDMKWDEEAETTNSVRGSSSEGTSDIAGIGGSANTTKPLEKPPMRRHQTYYTVQNRGTVANRRLSSYESFTKPQARQRGGARARGSRQGRGGRQRQMYLNPSHRNSVATTVSTTNASNILPIAYIPGVTVRPTKNNTRSIYSYEEESIFSDWNTIENASIVGDVMRASKNDEHPVRDPTTTAIKAQPRLVPVDMIEEEDEDDLSEDDKIDYSGVYTHLGTVDTSATMDTSHTHNYSSDSDVDSDIGEINRATSMRRTQPREVLLDENQVHQIPVDLSELEAPEHPTSTTQLPAGSFVLDVEMDTDPFVELQPLRPQPADSTAVHQE